MKKTIVDERTGWEYELIGEQYYPTGRMMRDGRLQPETVDDDNEPEAEKPVGIWGQRHLRYIKQHKNNPYLDLCVSGRLNEYLAEIEAQAEDMFFWVVKETSARESVTEAMKAENQMLWVKQMNNIRERAIKFCFFVGIMCLSISNQTIILT